MIRPQQVVLKMEFKRFRNAFIQVPCQIIKTGRKIVYRLLSWNRWLVVLFGLEASLVLCLNSSASHGIPMYGCCCLSL